METPQVILPCPTVHHLCVFSPSPSPGCTPFPPCIPLSVCLSFFCLFFFLPADCVSQQVYRTLPPIFHVRTPSPSSTHEHEVHADSFFFYIYISFADSLTLLFPPPPHYPSSHATLSCHIAPLPHIALLCCAFNTHCPSHHTFATHCPSRHTLATHALSHRAFATCCPLPLLHRPAASPSCRPATSPSYHHVTYPIVCPCPHRITLACHLIVPPFMQCLVQTWVEVEEIG